MGNNGHANAPDCDETQAFFAHIFEFVVITGTIMETDDRRTAEGVS